MHVAWSMSSHGSDQPPCSFEKSTRCISNSASSLNVVPPNLTNGAPPFNAVQCQHKHIGVHLSALRPHCASRFALETICLVLQLGLFQAVPLHGLLQHARMTLFKPLAHRVASASNAAYKTPQLQPRPLHHLAKPQATSGLSPLKQHCHVTQSTLRNETACCASKDEARALYDVALYYARCKNYKAARVVFERLLRKDPHLCKAWVSYAQSAKRAELLRGSSAHGRERFQECRHILQRGLQLNPSSSCLIQVSVELRIEIGQPVDYGSLTGIRTRVVCPSCISEMALADELVSGTDMSDSMEISFQ